MKAYRATLIEMEKSLKGAGSQAEMALSQSSPFISRLNSSFSNAPQVILTEPNDKPIGFVRPQNPGITVAALTYVDQSAIESGEVEDPLMSSHNQEELKIPRDDNQEEAIVPSNICVNGESPAESFVSMDFGRTSSEMTLEAAELREMNAMVIEKRLNLVNRLRTGE